MLTRASALPALPAPLMSHSEASKQCLTLCLVSAWLQFMHRHVDACPLSVNLPARWQQCDLFCIVQLVVSLRNNSRSNMKDCAARASHGETQASLWLDSNILGEGRGQGGNQAWRLLQLLSVCAYVSYRQEIVQKLAGQAVRLSQHKFASNVVEKCLQFGDPAGRQVCNHPTSRTLKVCHMPKVACSVTCHSGSELELSLCVFFLSCDRRDAYDHVWSYVTAD